VGEGAKRTLTSGKGRSSWNANSESRKHEGYRGWKVEPEPRMEDRGLRIDKEIKYLLFRSSIIDPLFSVLQILSAPRMSD
jgi:hypothetical protein